MASARCTHAARSSVRPDPPADFPFSGNPTWAAMVLNSIGGSYALYVSYHWDDATPPRGSYRHYLPTIQTTDTSAQQINRQTRRNDMKRIAFILCLLLPLSAGATVENVHEYHLDNGLTLIVCPDHRAPVVDSQIWYRVGPSYEHRGITGVSHLLEHMMFKGTETWAPGEFSRIIAAEGGRDNAFTGRAFTGYYQQLAADRLPIAFALEADRMQNLRLQEAEFALEHEVVKEERRQRAENNPPALMMERCNAVAHPASTYRQPLMGWMADIENYTLPAPAAGPE